MGVQVGCCVYPSPGRFSPTVIDGKITATIEQEKSWESIRGQSSYVYSKEMNKGSFGLSGSHGISGLSKVNWSVSAYLGKASAESSKSVKVNFEIMVCGGVEHVDFEKLTPSLLLAALKPAAQQQLTRALDAYLELNEHLKKRGKELLEVLGAPEPKDKDSEEYKEHKRFHKEFENWMTRVSDFKIAHGDGMVVAAAWGGIGGVSMEIKSTSHDSSWKYGGEAEFSYASAVNSVSARAVYDGSRSGGDAGVSVSLDKYSVGNCVAKQTSNWLADLKGMALDALIKAEVLQKAPDMAFDAKITKAPEFVKPKEDKGVASKIQSIDSLDALKAYAKASAYDEARKQKGNEKLTLEEFLRKAEKPADRQKVEDLQKVAVSGDAQVIPSSPPKKRVTNAAVSVKSVTGMAAKSAKRSKAASGAAAEAGPFSGYVPLGIWVSNWDHLFPWLATGWLNSILDTQSASVMIRYRMMMQDFLALSRLYYMVHNCNIDLEAVRGIDFKQIAESFGNACDALQEETAEHEYEAKMLEAYHAVLSDNARAIYSVWDTNSFLRGSELGLGVVDQESHSPHISENGTSFYSHAELVSQPMVVKVAMDRLGWFAAERRRVDFAPNGKSYSVFAGFYKVLPLIHPHTKKIYALGPGNGLLAQPSPPIGQISPLGFVFANKNDGPPFLGVKTFTATALEFVPNRTQRVLESAAGIKLYPIPFRAAANSRWRGPSFSVNVGSMSDLASQLSDLQAELKTSNAWGFSSDSWIPNWNANDYYLFKRVGKRYIGLLPEKEFAVMS